MSTRFMANSMTDVSVIFRPLYLCSSCRGPQPWCRHTIAELYTLIWVTQLIRISVTQNSSQTWTLARMFADSSPFISYELNCFGSIFWRRACERFIFLLPFIQVSKVAKEQIKLAEKTQLQVSMEKKTPLLQDNSEDTASTSYYLGNEVRN